jgi:hypothetical protein
MSILESYFHNNDKRLIHKWKHYFGVYETHFERFRGKRPVILEIGVSQGGSLQMWKSYFGEGVTIIGIDVDPNCKNLEEPGIQIHIGSQSDRKFLRDLKTKIPKVDIILDDGGHTMEQQIVSFEELFDHVKEEGIYAVEDLHTSYDIWFGGGHKRRGSFIEYSKNFIDYVNAWHSQQRSLAVNDFTRSVNSLHYYDGIMLIEKRKREKPYTVKSGQLSFESTSESDGVDVKALPQPTFIQRFRRSAYYYKNSILRFFRL